MKNYPVMYSNTYTTPENAKGFLSSLFPSAAFYPSMAKIAFCANREAQQGKSSDQAWVKASLDIINALERVGVSLSFENISAFTELDSPCVFIGNHMSTLETFVLPAIIQPHKAVTFVIKSSLLTYPFFGDLMASRDPIAVERTNPREDLKTVLNEGCEKISQGKSIIVFPQSTRSTEFDRKKFNSIGVKLAKKAGVPIVPLALKTDSWGHSKLGKEFGPIDISKKVHFAFDAPITVEGNGKEAHASVCNFIETSLTNWAK
ncbi:lysophospholipid acyltransferase family protein [Halodesulfovibrio sp.]|jgi:1-acyl-sn-glycerol-3-phosphate acyltransferase|uniref:lysophospholipid acyltransferase family protein n=1 Tax=Halodesulfovibrio sp. TaxID=1912772 RepID=UPI0025F6554C|nr:lysophospholipid acyltransferase family protein [Halodesulfovibrio sp.]MCT4533799.1 1-acyl-sn-glycerol-3-phosphate acyltransferase [Halodesulfovibrio sp.]MCT4627438.1 1-acyl-sn-glycerol-3-phosphate acyltransferase [Halodesulfovibrio sp.]